MEEHYKKILQASFLVALSGILYGFIGFLGTHILKTNISIATMLFWRFFIAGLWILLFTLRTHSLKDILFSIDKNTLFFMFTLGAIGYAGSSEFYFIASKYTGTGLAMVIFFSYPIIVALASWIIHRKKFEFSTILILLAMTIGLLLLRHSLHQQINFLGIAFAIIAAICYTIYVMGSKRIATVHINSSILTAAVCFGCAVIFLCVSLYSKNFIIPHSLSVWLYFLTLGIFITAIPIQLMLQGLKYISSMRASIISVLEPLITLLVGVCLMNESLSYSQILGVFIILSSALLIQFQKGL